MTAVQSLRGFRDVLPPESERLARLENQARDVLGRYGFRELRLPTLESRELFVKSTGETSDIVEKEMFTLQDSGGRELALRPEGTPGVVRAYLEASLPQKAPRQKLLYIGGMFRAERPQAGRYREFVQIGAEVLGYAGPAADADLILALTDLLKQAGLAPSDYALHLNTLGDEAPDCRPAYRKELLAYLESVKDTLCENCRRRMVRNPLRALDCKGDGPRLKAEAPRLAPCGPCREHYAAVQEHLKAAGLAPVEDPHLVRGLDYYTRTVFELKVAALGAQDAIAAGGRYDGLIKAMGGPEMPAVGWALGAERTLKALEGKERALAARPIAFVATQKNDATQAGQAFGVMQLLRRDGGNLTVGGGLFDASLKAQFKEADNVGARFAIVIGEEEAKTRRATVKDMRTSTQETISQDELAAYIENRLKTQPQ